jgi:hypothetical protein
MQSKLTLVLAFVLCVYADTYSWSTSTAPFTPTASTQANGIVVGNTALIVAADKTNSSKIGVYSGATGLWSNHQMFGSPYYNYFGLAAQNGVAVIAASTILQAIHGDERTRITLESYNSKNGNWNTLVLPKNFTQYEIDGGFTIGNDAVGFVSSELIVYNTTSKAVSYRSLAPLATCVINSGMAYIDEVHSVGTNIIFVSGGAYPYCKHNYVANTWTSVDLPVPRSYYGTQTVGTKLFFAGGKTSVVYVHLQV